MSIRILIVEDESLIRWSLRQKFEERGWDVVEAGDGKEAHAALAAVLPLVTTADPPGPVVEATPPPANGQTLNLDALAPAMLGAIDAGRMPPPVSRATLPSGE